MHWRALGCSLQSQCKWLICMQLSRRSALLCDRLLLWKNRSQNPPRATSWGFDPPPGTKIINDLSVKLPLAARGNFLLVAVLVAVGFSHLQAELAQSGSKQVLGS
jgi:hypothetical protein